MRDKKPSHIKLVYSNDKPVPVNDSEWPDMPLELQAIIRQKEAEILQQNLAPLEDFAGLIPLQMQELLERSFNHPLSPILLQPATEAMFNASALAQALAIALQFFAGEKGAKLTPQGRWPRKLILEIFPLFEHLARYPLFKPRLEEDLHAAEVLHFLLVNQGMLRKLKGSELLTKKGRELLAKGKLVQFDWLQTHMTETFNWAALDLYNDLSILQWHWPFMIWLLLNYGQEERPVVFYFDAFVQAWPMIMNVNSLHPWETAETHVRCAMQLRMIERWLVWLGWVSVRYEGKQFDDVIFIKATPEFFARWGLKT